MTTARVSFHVNFRGTKPTNAGCLAVFGWVRNGDAPPASGFEGVTFEKILRTYKQILQTCAYFIEHFGSKRTSTSISPCF